MKTNSPYWRIFSFGEETRSAEYPYWYVNSDRPVSFDISVIQYTLKGTLRYVYEGQEHLVHKGQACLFDYSDGSEYGLRQKDKSYSCFWISLAGAGLSAHWKDIRLNYGSVITDLGNPLLELMREVVKAGSFSGEHDTLQIASTVHHFITLLARLLDQKRRHSSSPVEQALIRLRNNPYYPWSIKELVDEEGCSREHFFREFKDRYGDTPAAWLNQRRAEQARYLLQTTRLTAEDIALQCGFSGAYTLSRTLRRIYQQGPNATRLSFGK